MDETPGVTDPNLGRVSPNNIVATAMSTANLSPSSVPVPSVCITMTTNANESNQCPASPQRPEIQRLSPVPTQSSMHSPGPEQMEVVEIKERQPSPVMDERLQQPQQTHQETHPMMIERENVILSEQSPKDAGSPIMAASPGHKSPQEGNADPMRGIVLLGENNGSTIPVSKDGHLMPPSPAHTPQPAPQVGDNEHGVRALVVINERGEQVMDPILQILPNQNREESPIMKEESYPITCGNSKGDLYWKKFICPGINAKCVRCHNMWMTPKEFVQEAGKSTLKDWKRAIRINGTMLRKMIESGEIDYYQHESNCSNQCRSNKGASLENTSSRESFNHSFDLADSREHSMSEGPSLERSNSEDSSMLSAKRAVLSTVHNRISQESLKSGMSSLERSSSEDSGLAPSPQLEGMVMRESIATADKIQDLQAFWSGIVRTDLFDEVVQDIASQVSQIHQRAKASPIVSPEDAVMMTNLANALELIPGIAQKMANHKMTVERQAEQTNHVIQELERKLAEQKRYDQDLKRKSQHLESVISLTPNEKRKRKNMVRLFRQKAIDARIPPAMQQPGTSGPSTSSRLPGSDMVGVVPLQQHPLRFPPHELWVGSTPGSTAVAHALQQVASNQMAQMNVSGRLMSMPIPPHMLSTHDPANFQVHPDSSKK